MRIIKKTTHEYKGFDIYGDEYQSSGGYVLGGRHYIEGGAKRNYVIKYNGKPIFNFCIIPTLAQAKQEIDDYLTRKNLQS